MQAEDHVWNVGWYFLKALVACSACIFCHDIDSSLRAFASAFAWAFALSLSSSAFRLRFSSFSLEASFSLSVLGNLHDDSFSLHEDELPLEDEEVSGCEGESSVSESSPNSQC